MTNKEKKELRNRLESFLEGCVDYPYEGVRKFDLSRDLAVYVGWESGVDPADPDLIYSKEDPDYALFAGIKCRRDSDWSDFESLNAPIDAEGDVACESISLRPREDCERVAAELVDEYESVEKALESGSARLC